MRTIEAKPLLDVRLQLGEGPVWAHGALGFVDIENNTAYLHRFDGEDHAQTRFRSLVGALLPAQNHSWIAAVQGRGLIRLDAALDETGLLAHPDTNPANRYNDGAIDPQGRLWIGTMDLACHQPAGSLFRIGHNGHVSRVLENLTISNGVAWSPDARTMYHIDTPTRRIDAYDFEATSGDMHDRRTLTTLDDGFPDGMCVDAQGGVWVARWGGSRVTRFDPATGRAMLDVTVPCANATACCFAGDDLDLLVITTAGNDTPRAGAVFGARTGHIGMESPVFLS